MAVDDVTLPPLYSPPPPRLTVTQALQRNALIAAIPVVVLVAIAAAIGLARHPVYTSEARLNVGGLNLTQQSTEGYVTAVQALAQAYARVVDANGVVKPTARKLHIPQLYVLTHATAVPVQGSPVVRVLGKGSSPLKAQVLADTVADSIVKYALNLNAGKSASRALRKRYLAASRDLQDAAAKLNGLKPNDPARRTVQTRIDGDRLEMQSSSYLYQQSQLGQSFTSLVQKLAPAGRATSDRQSVLQDYLVGGLVAGLLIGIGLAVWRANQMIRRRLVLESLAQQS